MVSKYAKKMEQQAPQIWQLQQPSKEYLHLFFPSE
jgi:hypothetical protein